MHASIEQLLTLRDASAQASATDQAITRHVAECASCGAELTRLQALREKLRGLPVQSPQGDPWPHIVARAGATAESAAGRRGFPSPAWPLALAASVLVAVLAAVLWPASQPKAPVAVELDQPATRTATRELVAESQRLEQLLRSVSHQPRVVNVGTADTIAQLEDRIALLDYGLSLGAGTQLDPNDAEALWRQRVELMNSLVQVRAAQAQRVAF